MTHSLGVRFGLAVFLLVWMPLVAVTGWEAYWLWQRTESRPSPALESLALRADALKLTEAASGLADAIDNFMLDRIVEVQSWAASPVVVAAVRKGRAAHAKEGLDKLGVQQIEGRFRVRKSLGVAPGARAYLSEQVRMSPHFAEVFFTDRLGFNVELTNPTSDFVQSDEGWWQRAWSSGLSVGEIEFDASANVWAVDLSVRIHDAGTGAPIGVMKAVLSVRFVQLFADRVARRLSAAGQLLHTQLFDSALDGRAPSSQFMVVTRKGLLIAETRSAHARGRIMQPAINLLTDESLTHLNLSYEGDPSGSFIATRNDPQNGSDGLSSPSSLVAFARSATTGFYASTVENFPGFDWMILVEAPNLSGRANLPELTGTQWQDQQGWMRDVLWFGAALCVLLLLSSIILCWLFGRWVLAPVRTLTNHVQRMAHGHISSTIALSSKGEFAELAAALDRIRDMIARMANRLRQTAAGQKRPAAPGGGAPSRPGPAGS